MSDRDDQPLPPPAPDQGRRCGRCGAINARADAVVCANCGALLAAYDAPAGSSAVPDAGTPVAAIPAIGTTALPVHRPTTGPPLRPAAPTTTTVPPTTTQHPPAAPVPSATPPPVRTGAPAAVRPDPSPSAPLPHAPSVPPTPSAAQAPSPPQHRGAVPVDRAGEDAPEEDRPDSDAVPAMRIRPVQPSSAYPARSRLARQTPQTVLLAGIVLVLLLCVLSVVLAGAGKETAAGLFIICGGPFALFVLGTGIVLLITHGRTDRFRK